MLYYQYNEANQLLQEGDTVYSYDANGNRIAKSDRTGQARYSYNANNFLVEFTSPDGESTGYGYDGSNRRAFKNRGEAIIESYLYDGMDVLQEVSGPNSQKITAYYRANGRIVTQKKKGSNLCLTLALYPFASASKFTCDPKFACSITNTMWKWGQKWGQIFA